MEYPFHKWPNKLLHDTWRTSGFTPGFKCGFVLLIFLVLYGTFLKKICHCYVLDPMLSVILQCQCLMVNVRPTNNISLSALLKRLHVFLVWILYFYQQDVCFYTQIKLSWQIWAQILLCICYWYIWYFINWLYRYIHSQTCI
jgi:ABC-type multidrug transport system permease subunit